MPAMTNFENDWLTTKRKLPESIAVAQSQQQQQQQERHHQDHNQNCKLYIELTFLPPFCESNVNAQNIGRHGVFDTKRQRANTALLACDNHAVCGIPQKHYQFWQLFSTTENLTVSKPHAKRIQYKGKPPVGLHACMYVCMYVYVHALNATHRLLSSSFWGLPYRILNIRHKKELLMGIVCMYAHNAWL